LNPSFTQAWSVYGWHLAWNLNTYATDYILKGKFLLDGEHVYQRAVVANPRKPRPYFDLAWLYLQRIGDYQKAMGPLETVMYGKNAKGEPLFTPLTVEEKKPKKGIDFDPMEQDRKWDPYTIGHRLAFVYKKHGVLTHDWSYIEKAAKVYQSCLQYDPKDDIAEKNMATLQKNMHNEAWMKKEYNDEMKVRKNFQMDTYAPTTGQSPMSAYGQGEQGHQEGTAAPNE
jgi:tetratricopeptide (TPR) repeat protein